MHRLIWMLSLLTLLLPISQAGTDDSLRTHARDEVECWNPAAVEMELEQAYELARIRLTQDRYDEALILLDQAEAGGGPDTNVTPQLRSDLLWIRGRIAADRGRFQEGRRFFVLALAPLRQWFGENHPALVPALLGLADVSRQIGHYAVAETEYRHCLALAEKAHGPAHPLVSAAALGVGICLYEKGDFFTAEAVLRHYLTTSVAEHGEKTDAAGMMAYHLAETLNFAGKPAEAIVLYRQAASRLETTHGPDHSRTAQGLAGLAHVAAGMGKQTEAVALYRRAIDIVERHHGAPHPDTSNWRCRMAVSLSRKETIAETLATIKQGIAETEVLYGFGSHQVALGERQLGLLLLRLRRCEEAREVFLRALAVLTQHYGADHPYLGPCLKGIGRACSSLGLVEEAVEYAGRAEALFANAAGRDPVELAVTRNWKTLVEIGAGQYDEAMMTAIKGADGIMELMDSLFSITSDQEAVSYASYSRWASRILLMALHAHPAPTDSLLARTFRLVAGSHGQVLDLLAERQRYLRLAPDDPAIARADSARADAVQRIAAAVVAGFGGGTGDHQTALATAYREQEEAERALMMVSHRLHQASATAGAGDFPSAGDMAAVLGPEDLLVHYVTFPAWLDHKRRQWHYGAFRLAPGENRDARPTFVDLGPTAPIDSLVFAYRRSVEAVQGRRRPSARDEAEARTICRRLHNTLWAPLALPAGSAVGDGSGRPAGITFLVAVAWLHLLDFNTLLSADAHPVIENHRLHLLSSGQDLLRPRDPECSGSGLLAVGNPIRSGSDMLETAGPCPGSRLAAGPLPGAEEEARQIAALFADLTGGEISLLIGTNATESGLKAQIQGRRIAHLATHGFFCDENPGAVETRAQSLNDPLLRSGLVLAATPCVDDGLLTAQEVVLMDLRGLDWVVLSACNSGMGRLVGGEGLFGLRRAFEIAGARTVIMALWQIEDQRMREQMESIYRDRLTGASTVDAVRRAQLDRLREVRRRWSRIHPALWAGIVAEGDWR